MAKPVVLYKVKDKIAFITLNRPEKRNALNSEVYRELAKIWEKFENDDHAWVAILSGAGKGFSSGMDQTVAPQDVDRAAYLAATKSNGITIFKPIIGAIHGFALGTGYTLAVKACDITIAAEGTMFGYPESRVGNAGIVPYYLPYMLFKKNLEFMLTGEWIDAKTACEWGLVNKVVPEAELMNEAIKLAEVLKRNAPLTLRAIKYGQYKVVNEEARRLAKEEEWETEHFARPQWESKDSIEGRKAFAAKREPQFGYH
jgi:enoyl-CoA hydratase/carnithine racemase